VTMPLLTAAITIRLQRWDAHAGNPVELVDGVREVAQLVTGVPAGDRARLVSLIARAAPATGRPAVRHVA